VKLRRVLLNGARGETGVAVWDADASRWVPLVPTMARLGWRGDLSDEAARDVVALLATGPQGRDEVARLLGAAAGEDLAATFALDPPLLPLHPQLLRNFASWGRHWEQAARGLTRRYFPVAHRLARGYEIVTRRTFPAFRPGPLFAREPTFYIGNHLTVVTESQPVVWPSFARDLDVELELAAVVCRPLLDATTQQAVEAIGGFLVCNDFTARDEQWRQVRHGIFGPTGKAKTFATGLGVQVVTPDEVLPHLERLTGEIRVNGQVWSTTSTAGLQHDFGDMLAYASRGEQIRVGEVLSSGTVPDGSGVEIDRWLAPGDTVTVTLERVGSLTSHIRDSATREGGSG
jgi:2-keto-4-pentenoate hydratase/2-oxohepta-3-ene-1,7-dioic acid hydratase in catechol pathway